MNSSEILEDKVSVGDWEIYKVGNKYTLLDVVHNFILISVDIETRVVYHSIYQNYISVETFISYIKRCS